MKIAHIINDGGREYYRVPFNSEKHGRYDSQKHFMSHEHSQLLERQLDVYVEITTHAFGVDQVKAIESYLVDLVRNGKIINGKKFVYLYGHYIGNKCRLILVPESDRLPMSDYGLDIRDVERAPKYVKRAIAPHEWVLFGKSLGHQEFEDGAVMAFELEDGYIGSLRWIKLDSLDERQRAIADGQNRISSDFLRRYVKGSKKHIETYGFKGTVLSELGLNKGYFHSQKNLKYDLVVYDLKPSIAFNDGTFMIGSLGELKPGKITRLDWQSMTNFNLYKFAVECAVTFNRQVIDDLKNHRDDKFRNMFYDDLNDLQDEEGEQEVQYDNWVLRSALLNGLSIFDEPFLFRMACNQIVTSVYALEKGRIPFDDYALRTDICPDPWMFDDEGNIHPEHSVLEPGYMCAPDIPIGETAEYRQPNGHSLEHSRSINVHVPQLMRWAGLRRCFYGPDLLEKNLPKNGADNDDSQVVVFNPGMVKEIYSLTYPITFKIDQEKSKINAYREVEAKKDKYVLELAEGKVKIDLDVEEFLKQMRNAINSPMSIGQLVNTINLDTELSGEHKENELKHLQRMFNAEGNPKRREFIRERINWLSNREDYQLRHWATNLEAAIDFARQGKGDPEVMHMMMDQIAQMRKETLVFPSFFGITSSVTGQSRTPIGREDFILANSLMDDQLEVVRQERMALIEALTQLEWNLIKPTNVELLYQYPIGEGISQLAKEIIRNWNSEIVQIAGLTKPEDRKRQYLSAVNYLRTEFEGFGDEELQEIIAVEIRNQVYSNVAPQMNPDKTLKHVRDGVFGNEVVFNTYLRAVNKLGLNAKYVRVDTYQFIDNNELNVEVMDTNVLRKDNNQFVGVVDAPNGLYVMKSGFIQIRPSKL